MSTHSTARRLAAVAVLALVATSAAACGGDDKSASDDSGSDSSSSSSATAELTEDQLGQVVLQPENFTDGWTQTPSDDSDDDSPGCLADVQAITDSVDEAAKVSYDYTYGDAGIPLVTSSASSFDDEDTLVQAFEDVKSKLQACSTVTGTDSDGTVYNLTMSYDDTAASGVDDQVNLSLDGSITTNGTDTTIAERISMARLGPNVLTTAEVNIGDSSSVSDFDAYTGIALDRFVAVVNGEEPAEATAPAPAA
jgi:hypothetical protein